MQSSCDVSVVYKQSCDMSVLSAKLQAVMWRVCCLLSCKQSCDMCVLSAKLQAVMWHVCVVCFSLSAVNWVARTRRWSCCRPLSWVFFWVICIALSSINAYYPDMLSWWWGLTLPSLSSRPTTLTCCRGDQIIYFTLTSNKAYTTLTYCHGDEGVYFALAFTKA